MNMTKWLRMWFHEQTCDPACTRAHAHRHTHACAHARTHPRSASALPLRYLFISYGLLVPFLIC